MVSRDTQVHLLVVAMLLCVSQATDGQTRNEAPSVGGLTGARWYMQWSNPWAPKPVSPVSFQNSTRIDSLMRVGNLYLSLEDAIALALENNLDIEIQRFGPSIAGSDVLRAKGGGIIRGVSLSVGEVPAGLGGPISPLLTAATPSTLPTSSASIPVNVTDLAAVARSVSNLSIITETALSPGSPLPIYDPVLTGQVTVNHESTPQSTSFITGTNVLITRNIANTEGFVQGFSTGTLVNLSYNSTNQNTNSLRTSFNPYTTGAFVLTVTQPLLRGFGMAVNRRFIRIADNNVRISDLVFRQQVIDTVAGVIRLYYDFVSLVEDANVKRQALDTAQKLYDQDVLQVRQGVLAPIDLVQAQAAVASRRQDLINAEGFAREQESILKSVLTRRGTAEPAVRTAHLIATSPVPAPGPAAAQPLEDLIQTALRTRPDVATADLQLTNAGISLEGSRNDLLPDVSIVGTLQNSGLAGALNPAAEVGPGSPFFATISPALIGGYGTMLSQLLRRNFPTYGIGIQLNLPIRNRIAQADYARDMLTYRQAQASRQQFMNTVRLEIENSVIALERTRAAYQAAVESRKLQEESLAAEQQKYAVGLSTTYLIIQYQTFAQQARSTEVAARAAYGKALTVLQQSLGTILPEYGISVGEAYTGQVSRPPTPLPPAKP